MAGKDDYFHMEEDFHSKDRKSFRKERKLASEKDRSKYKKTDQDKIKNKAPSEVGFSHLSRGRILAIHPEGIVVDSDGHLHLCQLKGSLKKEKGRLKNLVAVGDFVRFDRKEDGAASIVHIEERRSILSRADNLLRRKEQLIAVNIDQVLITASVVVPALKTPLLDRYIIASKKGNMQPILVVNKIDLLKNPPPEIDKSLHEKEVLLFEEFKKAYAKLAIPIILVSTKTGEGIEDLKAVMKGKTSVFSGQSGVGKTSLINAVTGSDLRIGTIVGKTHKGSHTTTTTHLLPIEGGGFCIDTPGIKSFGVWDLELCELLKYFPDFIPYDQGCKFPNCKHDKEPECGVKQAVEDGFISPLRFDSYSALMESLSEEHRHR